MRRKTWIVGGLAALIVAGSTGAAAVAASGGDDGDDGGPLTGSTRDRAVAAALDETGGGTVTEAEVADDGGAYSVEIELDDGSHTEVKLDESFTVIGQTGDDDGPNDQDGANDG